MLIYLLTIIEMCHCGCGNALKPKALHVFESRRKSPLWTYGADSRPSEWIHVRQCYSSDGGNIVFHKGEKRFLEINDTLLIIEEACLSLTFFFFAVKCGQALMFITCIFLCLFVLIDCKVCFDPNTNVAVFLSSVSLRHLMQSNHS